MNTPHMSENDGLEKALNLIEGREDVEIVLAVTTGSHAYDWASPKSDIDIGFIFKRRTNDYLRLRAPVEHILEKVKEPGATELDLHGWDMRKLVALCDRSNATAIEWLQPHGGERRRDDRGVLDPLREHVAATWNPVQLALHCNGHANDLWKRYLHRNNVKATVYMAVVRLVLRTQWLRHESTVPHDDIDTLIHVCASRAERPVLLAALDRRRQGNVENFEARDVALENILETRLNDAYQWLSKVTPSAARTADENSLDEVWLQMQRRERVRPTVNTGDENA